MGRTSAKQLRPRSAYCLLCENPMLLRLDKDQENNYCPGYYPGEQPLGVILFITYIQSDHELV